MHVHSMARIVVAIAIGMVFLCLQGCARNYEHPPPFSTGKEVVPPKGLRELIERKKILDDVHWELKNRFIYVSDLEEHQVNDFWQLPSEMRTTHGRVVGDCEEFALSVRAMLLERGIHSRLVLANTKPHKKKPSFHMVAEVDGWILDNRQSKVVSREDVNYRFLAISDYDLYQPWRVVIQDKNLLELSRRVH